MATVENKAFLLAAMIRRLAGFAFFLVTGCLSGPRLLSDSFYSYSPTPDPLPTDWQILGK
jgi:hypothetical protein